MTLSDSSNLSTSGYKETQIEGQKENTEQF